MSYGKSRLTAYDASVVDYCAANAFLFEDWVGVKTAAFAPTFEDPCLLWGHHEWWVPTERGLRPLRVDVNPREFAYVLAHGEPVPAGHVLSVTCGQPTCVQASHLSLWEGTWAQHQASGYVAFDAREIKKHLHVFRKRERVRRRTSSPDFIPVVRGLLPVNIKDAFPHVIPRVHRRVKRLDDHWLWTRFAEVRPRSEPVIKVQRFEVSVRALLFCLKNHALGWTYERVITSKMRVVATCDYPDRCVNPAHCVVRDPESVEKREDSYPGDVQYDPDSGVLFVIRKDVRYLVPWRRGAVPKRIQKLMGNSTPVKKPRWTRKERERRAAAPLSAFDDAELRRVYLAFLQRPNFDDVARDHGLSPLQVARVVQEFRRREPALVPPPRGDH